MDSWSAVLVALIVAFAAIVGPMLLNRQQNQRLDRIAAGIALVTAKVETVERMADGNLTAAYRAEWESLKAQLLLLQRNAELEMEAGKRPSGSSKARMQALEARIDSLADSIADRMAAQPAKE